MPLHLFHGDNRTASRKALRQLLKSRLANGEEVITLDGRSISRPDLETSLLAKGLFASQVIVLESLLSRPRGKEKDGMLTLVQAASQNTPIILWEGKTVKPIPKALSSAVVSLAKIKNSVYQFLDSLTPGNYLTARRLLTAALAESDPAYIFILFAKRLGDLLIAKSGDRLKLIPFQRSVLIAQANHWDEASLQTLHHRAYNIDLALKSGQTKLGYQEHLDLLLTSLLN